MNEMKSGKAPGLDRFPVVCLKKVWYGYVGMVIRLLNLSFDMGAVPMDWRGAFISTKVRVPNVNVETREVLVC